MVKTKAKYKINIQEINLLLCNYNINQNQREIDLYIP